MISRITYFDGDIFSGEPEDSPFKPIICIACNDPTRGAGDTGRIVIFEWEIYICSNDIGWHGTNKYADLMNHLGVKGCGMNGVRCVRPGLWIDNQFYKNLLKDARMCVDLARKSANNPIREDGRE